MMNTLNMNTNLQSQQNRHRNSKSRDKTTSKESLKSDDPNASENNMLMQRKENAIPLSISVDQKNTFARNLRKNPIVMAQSKQYDDKVEAERSDEDIPQNIDRPHPNDVLCGRGGSINAHAGNVAFRGWIQERRQSYNLADTKSAKTTITNAIFKRVKSLRPPGRFLHKVEPPIESGDINDDVEYWSEVEDYKALAKISQALREGAPAFRAAHGKPRKSQRSSQRRRNSTPASKNDVLQPKTRKSKRYRTQSSPTEAAYQRASITADMDISPPYYEDNTEDTSGLHLDAGNYNSLFSHNHMQSYKNSPYSNTEYGTRYGSFVGNANDADNNSRFDQMRPLNSHPMVPWGDYHASISDVANAIPPSPQALRPSATSLTMPDSLPTTSYIQVPPSPYEIQYEQFDPYSFLSPRPNDSKIEDKKPSALKREYSLSFSESELHDEAEFTNPFEGDDVNVDIPDSHTTTIKMWELPYTTPNDPFPSPHVTPPARGLSFEGIGNVPSGHFLGGPKSSAASSPGEKEKTANDRNKMERSIYKHLPS